MMTHATRRQQRADIAETVRREGLTIGEAAVRYGVSYGLVRQACEGEGVAPKRKCYVSDGLKVDPYVVLAELQKPKRATLAAIGAQLGISYQRVQQLKTRAEEAGVL